MRLRIDQIADSLGLKDIKLAIEHGAPSKLSGQGLPGSGYRQRRYHTAWHQVPAVGGDLDGVLPGKRIRRRVNRDERAVELFLAVEYIAKVRSSRLERPGPQMFRGDRKCVHTAQPDQRCRAAPRRCSERN